jgi:signal peptidase I
MKILMKMGKLKRVWEFLWESNSLLSWIVCLALVFLIMMGVFFPVLRLSLSTSLPLVIIESESMQHAYQFDQWYPSCLWYEEHNITKEEFKKWDFNNGLYKGDIIVVKGEKEYKKGDILIFKVQQKTPIIHRLIMTDSIMSTKGDNNCYQLPQEKEINKGQIIGKAVGRIPALGWIKLIEVDAFKMLISPFQK